MASEQVLLDAGRRLWAQRHDLERVLLLLRGEGASKVEAISLLRRITGSSLPEAKALVHQSRAWNDRAAADEGFQSRLEDVASGLPKQLDIATESPANSSSNSRIAWTHPSVVAFAAGRDPIEAIESKARQTVLWAVESGWDGPPFDPFALASMLGIHVVPREAPYDARTVSGSGRHFEIDFNPTRPRGRVRYSVAHEIAHTFFADCGEGPRYRGHIETASQDAWQLELLCNIAAAEILMPAADFEELHGQQLDVELLMNLRRKYDVSIEALFRRAVKMSREPCAMFAAARTRDTDGVPYRIDYVEPSHAWRVVIPRGKLLAGTTVLAQCSAVGFTAADDERWGPDLPAFHVEAVGIPPYPGSRFPRIAGLVKDKRLRAPIRDLIHFVRGDVTQPRGQGKRIIAHVVNDTASTWGGGFALVVRRKWPKVQDEFRSWAGAGRENLALGKSHFYQLDDDLGIFHMIAQHGYRQARKPGIRYAALEACLQELGDLAVQQRASVHMPRIGAGQARGNWLIIEEMIRSKLADRGVAVTVYDLPDSDRSEYEQGQLPIPAA